MKINVDITNDYTPHNLQTKRLHQLSRVLYHLSHQVIALYFYDNINERNVIRIGTFNAFIRCIHL